MSENYEWFDGFSRAEFIRRAFGTGVALTGLGALAGCGSDGSDSTTAGGGSTSGGKTAIPTKPFDPNVAAGAKPSLPKRIAVSQPFESAFYANQLDGLSLAAKERGLEIVSANALGDAAKQTQQINTFLQKGVGGLEVEANDPEAVRPLKQQAIDAGACVVCTVSGPSTLRIAQQQAEVGRALGTQAANWIETELGGKATVAYYPVGPFAAALKARDQAVIDAVEAAGGDVVVVEFSPTDFTADGAFKLTNTTLQANPDVKVWLGPDGMMPGALAALEAAGKAKDPDLFIGGIDGTAEALEHVAEGAPYRASIAQPLTLAYYVAGQFMADWLEGKSIPQAMMVKPIVLDSKAKVDEYKRTFSTNAVPTTAKSQDDYLTLLGNISYETRDRYLTQDL